MAMKTYHLRVKTKSPAHYVDFTLPTGERLWDFLFKENPKKLEPHLQNITGKIQHGINKEQIIKMDYLSGSGPFHFFSYNFLEKMQELLSHEVIFHKIGILAEDQKFDFYLANVTNTLNIVDHNLSQTYVQEKKFPPTIFKKDFERSFLIARESEPLKGGIVIVSDTFREECLKYKFNISFKETLTEAP